MVSCTSSCCGSGCGIIYRRACVVASIFALAGRKTLARSQGTNKPMLIAIAVAVSVIAADQVSKAFILSQSRAAGSNKGFLAIRRQLTRRGPLMLSLAAPLLVGLWIASIAI